LNIFVTSIYGGPRGSVVMTLLALFKKKKSCKKRGFCRIRYLPDEGTRNKEFLPWQTTKEKFNLGEREKCF
jgi:hypothetical protein